MAWTWPQLNSSCFWEHVSIAVQLGFLGLLLLHFLSKPMGSTPKQTTKRGGHGVTFSSISSRVSIVCSTFLLGLLFLMLFRLLNGTEGSSFCSYRYLTFYSESMPLVSWAITLFAVYWILKEKRVKYPWMLRSWWLCNFFLLVISAFSRSFVRITDEDHPRLQDYVEFFGLLSSSFLCWISTRGKAGLVCSSPNGSTDPPLHGKVGHKPSVNKGDSPYGKVSLLQRITFSWLNSLFDVGYRKILEQEDIPEVDIGHPARFLSSTSNDSGRDEVKRDGTKTRNFSIYKEIFLFIRKQVAINAFFAVTSAGASYVGPYLMDDFIDFLRERKTRSLRVGYLMALAFLSSKMVETIAKKLAAFGSRQIEARLRAALISHVYKKGLILSNKSRHSHTTGEIINYMSVDVERIAGTIWHLNTAWKLPIKIGLSIYLLKTNLGLGSLPALIATIAVMACNIPITRILKSYQSKIMEAKDNRMRATSEVLRNMKTIKLQAWDGQFLYKLRSLREIEYSWLWKSLRLHAISAFLFWGSPTFISLATFSGCMLMGIQLTAGRAISALAVFQLLQSPIFNLPEVLSLFTQAKVSLDRLASYLQEGELQHDAAVYVPKEQTEFAVEIDDGKFSWDTKSSNATLDRIGLKVKRGTKVAICGTVGSGKSSLLSCILGEIEKLSGSVKISGRKAYVPQSAWIFSGTIRDNILFGNIYDRDKYLATVEACALTKDFELLPGGDLTEIGERGINMSGGQKQRIQIARAAYQDADIYLLDDPFSAVDAHTGTQLFKECLMGILKDKTVLYVTHQVEFLPAADLILVMQNGRMAHCGTFSEILEQNIGFEVLVGAHNQAIRSVLAVENSRTFQDGEVDGECNLDLASNAGPTNRRHSSGSNQDEEITRKAGKLVKEEKREKGSIGIQVYWSYLTSVKGGALVLFILLAQSSFQVLQITGNYLMARATPPTSESEPVIGMNTVLLPYVVLAVGSSMCLLVRSILVSQAGILAAQNLFTDMLDSLMGAPMSFFDSTLSGKILNRASTDQSLIDTEIAGMLGSCAFTILQILGSIAVMSQAGWEVLLIFIPVTAISIWYQQYYLATSRELTRLAGIHKAPIFHHYAESLAGAAVIRAFGQESRFIDANLDCIKDFTRPWFHKVCAMEWLSLRLNFLAILPFGFLLVLLVILPEGIINPGIAGLAATYGMDFNNWLASAIFFVCRTESNMVSVERVLQYSKLPCEAPLVIESCRPPTNWPEVGTISFRNLQVRYAEHLPCILGNINCTFPGRRKVGIVGRTGSGKSTLVQAIFRIVEPTEGSIIIDDIDISKIGLHDLRSRLSIIPQDPKMFEGTVRGNIDPLSQYSDSEIWKALEKCQLADLVHAKDGKLQASVVENGENWSVGQKQLLCFGRAMLKKSNILVLDEATASVDSATDRVIQKIIGQEFKGRTVITIAHRIHTVIDSDLVLVLNDGRIAEYDTPAKLLERMNSLFSKLIKEYSMRSSNGVLTA